MSNSFTAADIEDVLGAIRRLVSEEAAAKARRAGDTDRLILTQAYRVHETLKSGPLPLGSAVGSARSRQSLAAELDDLEASVSRGVAEWGDDEAEAARAPAPEPEPAPSEVPAVVAGEEFADEAVGELAFASVRVAAEADAPAARAERVAADWFAPAGGEPAWAHQELPPAMPATPAPEVARNTLSESDAAGEGLEVASAAVATPVDALPDGAGAAPAAAGALPDEDEVAPAMEAADIPDADILAAGAIPPEGHAGGEPLAATREEPVSADGAGAAVGSRATPEDFADLEPGPVEAMETFEALAAGADLEAFAAAIPDPVAEAFRDAAPDDEDDEDDDLGLRAVMAEFAGFSAPAPAGAGTVPLASTAPAPAELEVFTWDDAGPEEDAHEDPSPAPAAPAAAVEDVAAGLAWDEAEDFPIFADQPERADTAAFDDWEPAGADTGAVFRGLAAAAVETALAEPPIEADLVRLNTAAPPPAAPAATQPENIAHPDADALLDEAELRALVAEVLREELKGPLGERITRNVRKLVRREIAQALNSMEID